MEAQCSLPESRKKRDATFDSNLAYGYRIEVSTDGIKYSEADVLVIYNSQCVNCTRYGNDVYCVTKVTMTIQACQRSKINRCLYQ